LIKLYLVEYPFIYQLTATSFMRLFLALKSSMLRLFAWHEVLEFYFHYKQSLDNKVFCYFYSSIPFISLIIEPFTYNDSYFGCDNIRISVIIAAILLFKRHIPLSYKVFFHRLLDIFNSSVPAFSF